MTPAHEQTLSVAKTILATIAAGASTGSLAINLIVHRANLAAYLKKRWKFVTLAVLVAAGSFAYIYGWLDSLLQWLLHPVTHPQWLYLVVLLVVVLAAWGIWKVSAGLTRFEMRQPRDAED